MSESKQDYRNTSKESGENSPLTATAKPQAFHPFSEEEIEQSHREWLIKAAVSSRRMALDSEYREERSRKGF